MGYTRNQPSVEVRVGRHDRLQQRHQQCQQRSEDQEVMSAASVLMNIAAHEPAPAPAAETLTEYCARLEAQVTELKSIVENKNELINNLNAQHGSSHRGFDSNFLKEKESHSDYRTKFLTGLPSYATFKWLYNYAEDLPSSDLLSRADVLLLLLMKLRLNLRHQDLAWRFGVSTASISIMLNKALPVLAEKLKFLIRWPSRTDVQRTMSVKFRRLYPYCRVIVDCTEIFVQRPRNLKARALFYSHYKHHSTLKLLIGITPTGAASFVSKAWGGRASDKEITLRSGLLNLLEPGDGVMSDRGFLIDDAIAARNAHLIRPAYTRGHKQMPVKSLEQARQQSSLRIHVERFNERLKNFEILSGRMSLVMVPHIDSIVTICCAICNLYPRLVKKSTS